MLKISPDALKFYVAEGWVSRQVHPYLPLSIYNYTHKTQFEKYWNEVTCRCRGLILENDERIIATGFPKFFNLEEKRHRASDSWEVTKKVDGSLGIIFAYNSEIVVATRGSFTSDQAIRGREIFEDYSAEVKPGWSYLVEIIYPANRIVCHYGEEKLVLLGAYDENFREVSYSNLPDWPHVVDYYGMADYEELQKQNIPNEEGYVIRWSNGDRAKVKFEEYCRLHRLMTGTSTKSVYECLRAGHDLSEVLRDTPDEFYDKIRNYARDLEMKYDGLYQICYGYYCGMKNIESRKEFAKQALETQFADVLFKMRDGQPFTDLLWKRLEPVFEKL